MSGTSMASPHTAGMLAYLLSLYPSATFNPTVDPDLVPSFSLTTMPKSFSSVYAKAHAVLPSWMAVFMPPPSFVEEVAPVPQEPETLSPKQLKKALLALSTPNALVELPANTINLLIFNNATA
jgi:cerevisin